jgi:hypothetical protein
MRKNNITLKLASVSYFSSEIWLSDYSLDNTKFSGGTGQRSRPVNADLLVVQHWQTLLASATQPELLDWTKHNITTKEWGIFRSQASR